jgi:hypothetical protein
MPVSSALPRRSGQPYIALPLILGHTLLALGSIPGCHTGILKCCSNFGITPIIDNKTIGCSVRMPIEPEITGLHKEALILQGV